MLKKKLSTACVKFSFIIFAGLMLVSFPAIARADAVFVSSASFSVFVAGFRTAAGTPLPSAPSALTLTSQVLLQTPDSAVDGVNASGDLHATAEATNGGLRFIPFVRGVAGAEFGFISGSWQTAGTGTVQNSSLTEGFFVDYTATIAVALSAQFDTALNEVAHAALALIIATSEGELVNFSVQQISPGFTDTDADFFTFHFSLFVPPGESRTFGAGLGVGGSAQTTPEPATMVLLGTGLLGVAIKARKRFMKNG